MRRIVIVGAGGHGQVVADILLAARRAGSDDAPIGYLDDDERLVGRTLLGLTVIGRTDQLASVSFDAAIVGVGNNASRQSMVRRLTEMRIPLTNAVHPSAIVSPSAAFLQGVVVAPGAVVNTGARIEDGAILNTSCSVDHHCLVGAYAHVAPGVRLSGAVEVGEGTLLGIGSVVLPGKRIGAWCVIGAGAIVTKDIPDRAVAVGVPAKVIRFTDERSVEEAT